MIDNGFVFWTLLKFALWLLTFPSAPMVLDKKVYFLCLDHAMFVCSIDTVNIIQILGLHILLKKFTWFFKTEGSVITFPQLLCCCHFFVQNTLVVVHYLWPTLSLSHILRSLNI